LGERKIKNGINTVLDSGRQNGMRETCYLLHISRLIWPLLASWSQ